MSKICKITGKRPRVANNVSKANNNNSSKCFLYGYFPIQIPNPPKPPKPPNPPTPPKRNVTN